VAELPHSFIVEVGDIEDNRQALFKMRDDIDTEKRVLQTELAELTVKGQYVREKIREQKERNKKELSIDVDTLRQCANTALDIMSVSSDKEVVEKAANIVDSIQAMRLNKISKS